MNFGGSGPYNNPNGNSNDMHPDDRRNLIIFILIAVVIYFAFDHFVMRPQVAAMRAAQIQTDQEKILITNGDDKIATPKPAMKSLQQKNACRLITEPFSGHCR